MRGAERRRESLRPIAQPVSMETAIPAAKTAQVTAMRLTARDPEAVSCTEMPAGEETVVVMAGWEGRTWLTMRACPGTFTL